eukprot:GHVR01093491.1.p2 GENE.GHVR01093491.1~~GHVR01093491.1.p2  ORF type:complete len:130 (-),score=4.97 GHVR01093491.1:125-514(-)
MLETVRHPYQCKVNNRTTVGTITREATKGVTMVEEVITVGMTIERKTVTEIMVNGTIQVGTTDVGEAMDEVETADEDPGEVTEMAGYLHKNQKTIEVDGSLHKNRKPETGTRKETRRTCPGFTDVNGGK